MFEKGSKLAVGKAVNQIIAGVLCITLLSVPLYASAPPAALTFDQIKARLIDSGFVNSDYMGRVLTELKTAFHTSESDPLLQKRFLEIMYIDLYRALRTLDLVFGFGDSVYYLKEIPSQPYTWFTPAAQRYPWVEQAIHRFKRSEQERREDLVSFKEEHQKDVLALQNALIQFHVIRNRHLKRIEALKKTQRVDQSTDLAQTIANLEVDQQTLESNLPIYFVPPLSDYIQQKNWQHKTLSNNTEAELKTSEDIQNLSQDTWKLSVQIVDEFKRNQGEPDLKAYEKEMQSLITRIVHVEEQKKIDPTLELITEKAVLGSILPNIKKSLSELEKFDHPPWEFRSSALAMRNNHQLWLELGHLNGAGLEIAQIPMFQDFLPAAYSSLMNDYQRYSSDGLAHLQDYFLHGSGFLDAAFVLLPIFAGIKTIRAGGALTKTVIEVVGEEGIQQTKKKWLLGPLWAGLTSSAYFQGKGLWNQHEQGTSAKAAFFSSIFKPSPLSYSEVRKIGISRMSVALAVFGTIGGGLAWLLAPLGVSRYWALQFPPNPAGLAWTDRAIKLVINLLLVGVVLKVGQFSSEFYFDQKFRAWFFSMTDQVEAWYNRSVSLESQIQRIPTFVMNANNQVVKTIEPVMLAHDHINASRRRLEDFASGSARSSPEAIEFEERDIRASLRKIAEFALRYVKVPDIKKETDEYLDEEKVKYTYFDQQSVRVEVTFLGKTYMGTCTKDELK